ncbi:MAG: TetR family transcriptional regulator [Sphingobacteriales bacterium SCN 48-20]|jgi:AcrR family transcriptional regulator|uniref:TetR/AcrR family transcriptional regulator n=1 Tax=Terrimonas ferruginea TaxID=249 RepID=UPI0003FE70E3|nr:TetR/AcrR family transcriptional regulator [Terrimonas ferruginea]MBN8782714.1 TetR/AcrR family transcriptional regulator [Terrimonas ferruginea]ODT92890.1 MAG: TetR family transcriptional regulator [Sphingobacteriales bacterium SCN 48-20]OJW43919.1 MAG: TetR family transcriptional regulator [Sphingobacteriales bacterium 48-107]
MGITERRIRQKEEVRHRILETAWQIVREEGWQALSIRKIADAIEYSVPVVYDHFENKEAILEDFSRQGFELLVKKLQAAKKKSDDPATQLKHMADAYWQFAMHNREYYQLMYGLGMACCEMQKCAPKEQIFTDLVMEPIQRILDKHGNKEASPCIKYHTYWSVMHGLISIKMVADSGELNKMVLDDAIAGFIKNLEK